MIVGANSANNVRVVQTGPTYANTYSQASFYGNSGYGSSTTYFGGQQTFVGGSHDTDVGVIMFNKGDPGFNNALDAKTELGPDWQILVADGIKTCE